MSALSLGRIAADRDREPPGSDVRRASETLIAMVPTEVLAAYTALTAVVMSAVKEGEYAPFRWSAYAAFVVLAAVAPIPAFRSSGTAGTDRRRIPVLECVGAGAAAGAWGIVMPSTPLDLVLNGTALTLSTAAVVLGVGTVLSLFSTALKVSNDRNAEPLEAAAGSSTPDTEAPVPVPVPHQSVLHADGGTVGDPAFVGVTRP